MYRNSVFSGFLALILAISGEMLGSVKAESIGSQGAPDKLSGLHNSDGYTREFAAQTVRPRITIHPRHRLNRYSVRHCHSWLVKEYRVSGPVIVPQMHCYWD